MSDSAVESVLPLTPLQEGLLFHALYDAAAEDVYVVRLTVELAGPVEPARLAAAARSLLERYPNLRAAFRQRRNGTPVQIVPRRATADFTFHDLESRGADDAEAEWARLEEADRQRRFDLAAPPLLRFTLAKLGPQRFRLLLTHHHLLLDGWSVPIVLRELLALYRGRELSAPPPFAGYLEWLGGQDRAAAETAWRELLAGVEQPTLLMPGLDAAPAAAGANTVLELSPAQTEALAERARALGVTVNPLVQAAWAIVLGRLTGRDDVVYGTTVAVRPPEVPGIESMVGLFINTLPMRVRLRPEQPLSHVVRSVRDGYLGTLDHQHVGLADVRRAAGDAALFDTLVVFENYPYDGVAEPAEPGEVRIAGVRGKDATHYPVTLVAVPGPSLRLRLAYRPDLVSAEWARACLDRVHQVLCELVADPEQPLGRINVLLPAERARAVAYGGPEARPATVPELFGAGRTRTPDAVAVVAGEAELTYAELDARASRLAAALAARGCGPERIVAVAMPRSVELIVALLAVAKTGAAYLPLDPEYPARRLALMVQDARPLLVVVNPAASAGDLPAELPRVAVDAAEAVDAAGAAGDDELTPPHPEHPAYVMYTSGSTGRPKGVVVRHRDVTALALDSSFASGAHRRVLFHSPHTFDASLLELWVPLLNGATIVLAPPERLGPAAFERLITCHRITAAGIVAGLFSVLAEESPSCLTGLEEVWAGGDVVAPNAVRAVFDACPGISIVDSYGPTETTLFALRHRITGAAQVTDPIPIGTPMDGMRAFLLDSCLQPVPDGVLGELYVAGDGLARGYLGRPDLTAQRFLADPFGPPGARMYRTGDLARRRADGAFEFAGRADAQVKIRGFRVEPGELESVLSAHPDVASAVVVVREDQPGDKRLVGYAVPRGGPAARLDTAALREYAAERVPAHLVPAAVMALDELPLTGNGKLDRGALPAPEAGSPGAGVPRTPQQEILCGLFGEVLGRSGVGVHDDFFALGGHSLLATRLTSRIRSVLGAELPVRAVFDAPTVAELARRLASGERRPALIRERRRPAPLPLSFGQQRLWFLSRLQESSAAYHICLALRISGPLSAEALAAALRDVVQRHEVLRTTYSEQDGTPYQLIHEDPAFEVPVLTVAEPDLAAVLSDAAREEFDLARDLPLRATLYQLAPETHVLLLVAHHIAADGWSIAPLLADLDTAYTAARSNRAPGWRPLPVQYTDYVLWQREQLADDLARQRRFWRRALDGLPEELELPTDRPRPAIAGGTSASVPVRIGPRLHRAITEAAVQHRVTVFMAVQSALAVLLCRLGAGEDIPLGSTIAGRTDDALDGLVGFFVNTLVLRTDVSGDPTFAELLKRVREFDLSAYAHQDVPFEQLVEMLEPERSLAHHPLFQVMLAFQNAARSEPKLDGVSVATQPVRTSAAKFDLLVELAERHGEDGRPEGITGQVEYRTDLFDADTATRLADRFVLVLEQLTAQPRRPISEVDVLLPAERQLLAECGEPVPPAATIAQAFAEQAARTPDSVALIADSQRLTYRELDTRATGLACALAEQGAGPERIVAVALPRSVDLVVALLATAKAGAAYLPLDPGYPTARLALMVADARPAVLVCDAAGDASGYAAGVATVDVGASGAAHPVPARPDGMAYVMYTSGSTGRPKGVVVRQADVTALAADPSCRQAGDRVLFHSPHTFDAATFEVWVPLLNGGTVVIAPPGPLDAARISELVKAHGLTALWLTAGLFAVVAQESPECLAGLREVWAGGDVVPAESVRVALSACPGLTVVNGYGPTETTTFALRHRLAEPVRARVPIGTPLAGTRVYVLDHALRAVPPGVPGELYVAGAGVARGYLDQPGRTAERFLADPHGTGRMYRTGDRVRSRPDGVIEFLGRADDQVKIRGFRIEPGEVEHVLADHPAVDQAVVLARGDRLVAYAVGTADERELRRHLADRLPSHLVPSAIVVLDRFPLTGNGKTDRAALPDPAAPAITGRAPETPDEQLLCELFAAVLGVPRVGADDGFFALGGDSISSVRLVARARAAGLEISVRDVFGHPTPAALARRRAGTRSRFAFDPVLPLCRGTGEALFCIAPASGIAWIYARLAEPLECPIYGLQAPGLHPGEDPAAGIEQLVELHLPRIRAVQPEGPYRLMGHSFGGLVAHALATALQAEGERVSLLALLDCYPARQGAQSAATRPEPALGPLDLSAFELSDAELDAVHRVRAASARLAARFVPGEFDGDAVFFSAAEDPRTTPDAWQSWARYIRGRIENHDIAADHHQMMRAARPLSQIARVLKEKTRKGTDL